MRLLNELRTIAVTVGAMVSGAVTMATGGGDRDRVVLKPGDVAPDFTLAGSDGRTYRLRDLTGRDVVVLAWFPKAFTGG